MPTQSQTEATNAGLKELFNLWDSRAGLYREVMYSSAILRGQDSVWRNVFTFFQPLHKSEERSTDLKADYGHFTLAQGLLPLADVKKTLTEVVETEQMSLPNQPVVRIKASLHPGSSRYLWRGDARNYPVYFPFFEYRFGVEQSDKAGPPQGTLWAPHLPLYPSGHVAIEDLMYTRLGNNSAYEGVLSALVPDYRGKISEIRLLNDGVAIRVICLAGADLKDLAGKLYCEGYHGNRINENLEFDDTGKAFASTQGFPRHLVVALVSKSAQDLIDERTFDAGSPYLPTDLTNTNSAPGSPEGHSCRKHSCPAPQLGARLLGPCTRAGVREIGQKAPSGPLLQTPRSQTPELRLATGQNALRLSLDFQSADEA